MEYINQTCCFTGHRNIPQNEYSKVKECVREIVEILYEQGVIYYGCGMGYGFDLLCGSLIIEIKKSIRN